ncbi:MAG TPA: hypothetical protein VGR89_00745 [Puia sp.]|nr:hypothetical protein [Puia sp.]
MKHYLFLLAALVAMQTSSGQNQAGALPLPAFAGKYQFTGNKMTFLQISVKDSGLLLKQLWDNGEVSFARMGPLNFYNDEHSFPLLFKQDSLGRISEVMAFNRDRWIKVPDKYQAELQTIVQLTPQQLRLWEGKYELEGRESSAYLTISASGDHLVLTQLWNQGQINLSPVAGDEFVNGSQDFHVKFTAGENGKSNQLEVNGRDKWLKVKD